MSRYYKAKDTTDYVCLNIETEVHEWFKAYAKKRDSTKAEMIRYALDCFMKAQVGEHIAKDGEAPRKRITGKNGFY